MKRLHTYHHYFLLLAMAYRILILGGMLTLATHNICLQQMVDEDKNLTKLILKSRKREEKPVLQVCDDVDVVSGKTPGNIIGRTISIVPAFSFVKKQFYAVFRRFEQLPVIPRMLAMQKIFLRHCSLRT